MYAIVEIAGQQFKVEEGRKIFVHRLGLEEGSSVEFDRVLLIEDGDRIVLGEPHIKDALVEGRVLSQVRGDKVIVFKKKRRKGYQKSNGHRQSFSHIEIVSIHENAAGRKTARQAAPKAAGEPAATAEAKAVEEKPDSEVKAPAAKKAAAGAAKKSPEKAPAKKAGEEKTAVKKAAVKKAPAAKKAADEKPAAKKTGARKPAAKKSGDEEK